MLPYEDSIELAIHNYPLFRETKFNLKEKQLQTLKGLYVHFVKVVSMCCMRVTVEVRCCSEIGQGEPNYVISIRISDPIWSPRGKQKLLTRRGGCIRPIYLIYPIHIMLKFLYNPGTWAVMSTCVSGIELASNSKIGFGRCGNISFSFYYMNWSRLIWT